LENAASILFNLAIIIFLVLLNGFFVAAEFAIVKVRSSRIAQMEYQRRKVAQKVLANLDAYLSATQLGITLASLGLGWIGEPAIAKMIAPLLRPVLDYFAFDEWVLHAVAFSIAFSIITFMHIVLGEMAPKSLAIRQAEKTTLWTATPLDWFYRLFKPFIYILNGAANLTLKGFGVELNETQQAHTEEEIRMLIAQSHRSGVIDQTELTLFDNVFDFTDRVAREVMVPRVNMECLFLEDPFAENFVEIRKARHTRFPLCGEDKDDVKGIIHIRDVYERIASGETAPQLDQLARPAVVVPESMELKDILRNLQKNRAEMAIVVDEYGGTSGLVTTEDIIEEIFGEIQDEFDDEKPFFLQEGEATSIDARLLIEEVNEHFNINIEDEDNDTIGGWLFSELGTVPKVGDQVPFAQWLFTVEEVSQLRIARIMVTVVESKEQGEIEEAPLSM
jgi:CBS domain containing-hemolysin-like protein